MSYLDFIDPGNAGGSVVIPEIKWSPSPPTIYTCRFCSATFLNYDELFEHRFENHPFLRPALIFRGMEITTPRMVIAKPIVESDVVIAHTNTLKINGKAVSEKGLIKELSCKTQGIVEIRLKNEGVESLYELEFDIPDQTDLNEVDRLFFALLGTNTLDIAMIDNFIDITEQYSTARRYVDGLSKYLYGLLAKDQRGGTHLEQRKYKERFNGAFDILRIFETPLAAIVNAIISFNQNIFIHSNLLSFTPQLQQVMERFVSITQSKEVEFNSDPLRSTIFRVPLDRNTDQLIAWSLMDWTDLIDRKKELELVLKSPQWVFDDRIKVRVLLAELYVVNNDFSAAKAHARSIVNNVDFGDWAQSIMDRSK